MSIHDLIRTQPPDERNTVLTGCRGQNTGAQPLMTQVLGGDIKVIIPRDFRQAEPIFPMKA